MFPSAPQHARSPAGVDAGSTIDEVTRVERTFRPDRRGPVTSASLPHAAINAITIPATNPTAARQNRVYTAVFFVLSSPDFIVQK